MALQNKCGMLMMQQQLVPLLICVLAWWDLLCGIGPQYGYFVFSSKTFLIFKEVHLAQSCSTFSDTRIQITTEGRHYLDSTVGFPGL